VGAFDFLTLAGACPAMGLVPALSGVSMKKTIEFVSIVTTVKPRLRFSIIETGERIGFGHEQFADQPKVACEELSNGIEATRTCVVNASELAALDAVCVFAPFPGTGMSGADAARLREWVKHHIDRIAIKEDVIRRWVRATPEQTQQVLHLARVSNRYANSAFRCLSDGIQSRLAKAILQVVPAPDLQPR